MSKGAGARQGVSPQLGKKGQQVIAANAWASIKCESVRV
jgi:hypothetical protein